MSSFISILNPPLLSKSQAHPPPMANLSNFFKQPSPPQPATTTPSFETLESSINDIVNLYERRRKWRTLFATPNPNSTFNTLSPWRAHLITFLESTPAHVITIVLLLMDLIITVLELSSSLITCGSPASHRGGQEVLYLHWVGISILSLLSTKALALVVGLGCSLFRQPGCIVDGVVAAVALVLEVAAARKGGGVIVVASLWRLVRVVESAFELSDDAIERKIEGIVWELERMKEEIRRQIEML